MISFFKDRERGDINKHVDTGCTIGNNEKEDQKQSGVGTRYDKGADMTRVNEANER